MGRLLYQEDPNSQNCRTCPSGTFDNVNECSGCAHSSATCVGNGLTLVECGSGSQFDASACTGCDESSVDCVHYNDTTIPVYVSLTSIVQNQNILVPTLEAILQQSRQPDKIFLYLSEEAYILDTGFEDKEITNTTLKNIIDDNAIIDVMGEKHRSIS